MGNKYKEYLALKLGVPKYKIKKDNLPYYYSKWPELCCRYNLKPVSEEVGPYEFQKAVKILVDYYKDVQADYYKNLYKEAKKYKDGESILEIKPNQKLDQIVGEYIRFRPNTRIITLWPNASGKLNELLKLLNEHGHVYYIRKFNLNYNAAKNLIYQIYGDTHRLSTIPKIEEKLKYIGWKKDGVSNFKIVVFDHQSDVPISGSMAPLKQQIRKIWMPESEEGEMRGDDYVHINDNFYLTVEYCKLFFNRNTLLSLHYQNLEKHLSKGMTKCRIYINTVKNWIIRNVHPIDYDRFIFMGSTVLYVYGIRVCRDVDGLLSPRPEESKTPLLEDKIRKSFFTFETKFFFADIGMQDTDMWKESWDEKDKPWFDSIGIKYRDELIFNPENYFYYNGIKFVTLLINSKRRIIRRKVSDFGDLLQIEKMTNIEIKYPKIPDEYTKEEFVKLLQDYMSERYPDNKDYMDKVKKFI